MLRQKWRFSSGAASLAEYGERWCVVCAARGAAMTADSLTHPGRYKKQDGFEVGLLQDDWSKQKVPLCISHEGLFIHSEIDG